MRVSDHAFHHFPQIFEVKQKRKLISPMQLPHCPPWYRNSCWKPVSVYLKAQRSMLMRHMHMGIIMDIMIACCFILRFSYPH